MTRCKAGSGLAGILTSMILAACGPAQVTIVAQLDDENSDEVVTLESVEVQLLPYDRDQVFDSLAGAASTPEPEVPADLLAAQEEIARAQQEWRDTETNWNDLRDELQRLNARLEDLNPGMTEYRTIFNEWQDRDAEYQRAERQVGNLFDTFTSLQQAAIGRMDSMNIVKADWEDQAFEDVQLVIAAKLELSGLDIAVDTTDANGIADFEVAPGQYWVYARHELPYDELYWNVPIAVTREEPFVLRLSHENAVVRPIF